MSRVGFGVGVGVGAGGVLADRRRLVSGQFRGIATGTLCTLYGVPS